MSGEEEEDDFGHEEEAVAEESSDLTSEQVETVLHAVYVLKHPHSHTEVRQLLADLGFDQSDITSDKLRDYAYLSNLSSNENMFDQKVLSFLTDETLKTLQVQFSPSEFETLKAAKAIIQHDVRRAPPTPILRRKEAEVTEEDARRKKKRTRGPKVKEGGARRKKKVVPVEPILHTIARLKKNKVHEYLKPDLLQFAEEALDIQKMDKKGTYKKWYPEIIQKLVEYNKFYAQQLKDIPALKREYKRMSSYSDPDKSVPPAKRHYKGNPAPWETFYKAILTPQYGKPHIKIQQNAVKLITEAISEYQKIELRLMKYRLMYSSLDDDESDEPVSRPKQPVSRPKPIAYTNEVSDEFRKEYSNFFGTKLCLKIVQSEEMRELLTEKFYGMIVREMLRKEYHQNRGARHKELESNPMTIKQLQKWVPTGVFGILEKPRLQSLPKHAKKLYEDIARVSGNKLRGLWRKAVDSTDTTQPDWADYQEFSLSTIKRVAAGPRKKKRSRGAVRFAEQPAPKKRARKVQPKIASYTELVTYLKTKDHVKIGEEMILQLLKPGDNNILGALKKIDTAKPSERHTWWVLFSKNYQAVTGALFGNEWKQSFVAPPRNFMKMPAANILNDMYKKLARTFVKYQDPTKKVQELVSMWNKRYPGEDIRSKIQKFPKRLPSQDVKASYSNLPFSPTPSPEISPLSSPRGMNVRTVVDMPDSIDRIIQSISAHPSSPDITLDIPLNTPMRVRPPKRRARATPATTLETGVPKKMQKKPSTPLRPAIVQPVVDRSDLLSHFRATPAKIISSDIDTPASSVPDTPSVPSLQTARQASLLRQAANAVLRDNTPISVTSVSIDPHALDSDEKQGEGPPSSGVPSMHSTSFVAPTHTTANISATLENMDIIMQAKADMYDNNSLFSFGLSSVGSFGTRWTAYTGVSRIARVDQPIPRATVISLKTIRKNMGDKAELFKDKSLYGFDTGMWKENLIKKFPIDMSAGFKKRIGRHIKTSYDKKRKMIQLRIFRKATEPQVNSLIGYLEGKCPPFHYLMVEIKGRKVWEQVYGLSSWQDLAEYIRNIKIGQVKTLMKVSWS